LGLIALPAEQALSVQLTFPDCAFTRKGATSGVASATFRVAGWERRVFEEILEKKQKKSRHKGGLIEVFFR